MNVERARTHMDPVTDSSDEHAVQLPNFLVVGAMRSGTTSLARYLGSHPDVFVAPEKEIHFFDRYFDRGVDWYGAQFARAGHADAVGEATQSYMYDSAAIARMKSTVPSARLLAILRHPTDRAYSHYWLNRARGLESLSFEAAIEEEAGRLLTGRRSRFVYSYVDRGRYVRQLESLCEAFPRSSLCVLIFEEMRLDPQAAFEIACRHIDVDPAKGPPELGKAINAHVTFRSPRLRRYSKRLPRALRTVVGRLNTREGGYAPMQAETRISLDLLFRSEIDGLAEWLGRDVPSWARS
jgi:hypothetical protein